MMKKLIKASDSRMSGKKPIKASYDPYTENLADFGMRELEELRDILTAWIDNGLPDDFYDEEVRPAFNRNSGYVFLTNSEYQVAVLEGNNLRSFYTTPYSGHEGTYYELLDQYDETWEVEDLEYVRDLAADRNDDDAVAKLEETIAKVESGEV